MWDALRSTGLDSLFVKVHRSGEEVLDMSFIDKAKNAAEDAVGKAKEVIGDKTDNKDLETEGKTDQGKAGVKKVGENIKDTFK
jgi:uncharacterized protein YjbJ (UPF0337 family)